MRGVVLIHGYLETPEMWDFILPNSVFPILRLTQPGHGPNALPAVADMEELAEAAWARIREAGIDKAHFIGHSMGGYLALACARQHPDKVSSVCLFHSTGREDNPEKKVRREKAIEAIGIDPDVYLRATIIGLYAQQDSLTEAGRNQIDRNLQIVPENLQTCLRIMKSRGDCLEFLKTRKFSLAYVLGTEDAILSPAEMEDEASITRPDMISFIENAGHMSHREQPDKASELIKKWILRVWE